MKLGLGLSLFTRRARGGGGANPLSPYYGIGPGKIAIHYATDAVTLSGGNVVALQNKGGAGAVFNAVVSGEPIPILDQTLSLTETGGRVDIANPASLDGVRFMFVADLSSAKNSDRVFGGPTHEFRLSGVADGLPRTGVMQTAQRNPSTVRNATVRFNMEGLRLYEFEVDLFSGTVRAWLDGLDITVAPPADLTNYPDFLISNIGSSWGGEIGKITCRMGDVLGVTLGAGGEEAIAAARVYLSAKFGITLP